MKIGFVYDLRDDYLALGFSEEETAEFDSRATIDAVSGALTRLGWQVELVGRGQELARRLVAGERFDLVFSIAEGLKGRSREAQVPALCELYDQPYAFSDPLTMAVTLDKSMAKRIVRDHGIATAPFAVITGAGVPLPAITYPAFVKPVAEGTGKGCANASKVSTAEELASVAGHISKTFHQPALAEAYLPGREFTVGITGNDEAAKVIAVMEIAVKPDADSGIYSYQIKENWEPFVRLSLVGDAEAELAGETALAAYRALGCRDAARVDLRSDEAGIPQFLEVNPIAGLHPTHSDLPILVTKSRRSYDWLIAEIVSSACGRYGIALPRPNVAAA